MALLSTPGKSLRTVVIGASGGIGDALVGALEDSARVGFIAACARSETSRRSPKIERLTIELTDENTIAEAAARIGAGGDVDLVIVATGILHETGIMPEKSIRQIDAIAMARAFQVNAIGPALVMKHFLPLLPRDRRSVFAILSAKVGSIGDNHLGGWYSYRASKAALNQIIRTAAIELKRRAPQAALVALHPGTVESRLSAPFGKAGLDVRSPADAAERLLGVIDGLAPAASGGFFDYRGERLPW